MLVGPGNEARHTIVAALRVEALSELGVSPVEFLLEPLPCIGQIVNFILKQVALRLSDASVFWQVQTYWTALAFAFRYSQCYRGA